MSDTFDTLDIEAMVYEIVAKQIAAARKEILDYMSDHMIEHLRRQHPGGQWVCMNCGPK